MGYVNFYHYLFFSGLAIAAYYLILSLVYYRSKLLSVFKNKPQVAIVDDVPAPAEDAPAFELASTIQAYLIQAGIEKMDRAQVLSGLRQLITRQGPMLSPELQEQLRPIIVSVCRRALGVGLNEAELNFLWPAAT